MASAPRRRQAFSFGSMPVAALVAILFWIGPMANSEATGAGDPIEPLRAKREAYIEHFRIYGQHQPQRAIALETHLQGVLRQAEGSLQASALYELATIQRITDQFNEAITTYRQAAGIAADLGLKDLAFDAWIGIARAHAYGTRDHGAAAEAFGRAVEIAGEEPTRKQSYEIADYASQLQSGRGELEAALVSAIEANRLAADDTERFYARLDAADVLQKFAESCDYRKLVDARTHSDGGDSWGACRRAVGSARSYYEEARDTAKRLGWRFMREQAEGFLSRLDLRLTLIESKASFEQLGTAQLFTAQTVGDVLVNEEFSAGASELSEYSALGEMISQVVPDAAPDDPRSLYLLGIRADLAGQAQAALDYFERAVRQLEQERSSMFDLRRRGTVVENRPELIRDLALRLLALGQYSEAFRAFESLRARGLGQLAAAYERNQFSDAERRWLSALAELESRESAILNDLVETTIAGVEHSRSVAMTDRLAQARVRHRELLGRDDFRETIERLASTEHVPATLEGLQALVLKSGTPVLLYWVTHTNVVAWVISPRGMEVKTVFLPEVAVIDKVERLVRSIRTADLPFDETAARELHAYLIQPFADHLSGRQILIVPQGPLVTLPFEALIDPRTGNFLVETLAVSYAPSATFAARALESGPPDVAAVTAVYDQDLEQVTGEISRIGENRLVEVTASGSQDASADTALELLGGHAAVHVLLHGFFEDRDPLQSWITLNNPLLTREDDKITAAELLAVDWRNTRLAVFSSCEGAMMNIRISNEVYGLSWAPLVGGADHLLMSRWRVESQSNADWMAIFYETLASEQTSPAMAAAEAMRKMIDDGRDDPFLWAGPQVFGR